MKTKPYTLCLRLTIYAGGQSREAKTGEVWSLLLIPVRTLATAFWMSCRLLMESFGHADSNELQLSSLGVTNAWTSFLASLCGRMLLILAMLRRGKKDFLEECLLWGESDTSWSEIIPGSLAVALEDKAMSTKERMLSHNLDLRCLGSKNEFGLAQRLIVWNWTSSSLYVFETGLESG